MEGLKCFISGRSSGFFLQKRWCHIIIETNEGTPDIFSAMSAAFEAFALVSRLCNNTEPAVLSYTFYFRSNLWRLLFQETARTQRRTSCPQRKLSALKVRNVFVSFRINLIFFSKAVYVYLFLQVCQDWPHQAIVLVDQSSPALKNSNT